MSLPVLAMIVFASGACVGLALSLWWIVPLRRERSRLRESLIDANMQLAFERAEHEVELERVRRQRDALRAMASRMN